MLENIFCFTLGLVTPGIATTVLVKEVLKAKREESVRNRELKEENEALKKKNDELVDEIVNELERNGELCNIIRDESARNRELKEENEKMKRFIKEQQNQNEFLIGKVQEYETVHGEEKT